MNNEQNVTLPIKRIELYLLLMHQNTIEGETMKIYFCSVDEEIL